MATRYQGILFPERAESLSAFQGYKVFLSPWDPLATELRRLYEGLALRRETRILAVYGPQGTGKTLFANKLHDDLQDSKVQVESGGAIEAVEENLWHRITGGQTLDADLIRQATNQTQLKLIENTHDWVDVVTAWAEPQSDRNLVVLADNAERAYFRQGLVNMSDVEFAEHADRPATIQMAAQRCVDLARTTLRGCLFVIFSNDQEFLIALHDAMEQQHRGLMVLDELPMAKGVEKEIVVRVNTNRLNAVSYWFCLDKAGPQEKAAVKTALEGASTFPDSFEAVNTAISTATPTRIGRPARKNVVTLVVLTRGPAPDVSQIHALGRSDREIVQNWFSSVIFESGWGTSVLHEREGRLLESEWVLRVVTLGDAFVDAILAIHENHSQANAYETSLKALLEKMVLFHHPGTQATTRERYEDELRTILAAWPPMSGLSADTFWSQGQTRSVIYEPVLAKVLTTYNVGTTGSLGFRPDFVDTPFTPCSILSAQSNAQADVNSAIRRNANLFEFTAAAALRTASIQEYLRAKLENYVFITQEQ